MISSTLGALGGGVIRGAHQGRDCRAASLITPPKGGAGAGNWLPLSVVVASGAPRVPVIVWANTGAQPACQPTSSASARAPSRRSRPEAPHAPNQLRMMRTKASRGSEGESATDGECGGEGGGWSFDGGR